MTGVPYFCLWQHQPLSYLKLEVLTILLLFLPYPVAKSWQFFPRNLFPSVPSNAFPLALAQDFIISCLYHHPISSPFHLTCKWLCFQHLHLYSIQLINTKWKFPEWIQKSSNHAIPLLRNLTHLSNARQVTFNLHKNFYSLVPIYLSNPHPHFSPAVSMNGHLLWSKQEASLIVPIKAPDFFIHVVPSTWNAISLHTGCPNSTRYSMDQSNAHSS